MNSSKLHEMICLQPMRLEDVTEVYVGWLNDPNVMKYTIAGQQEHSLASTREYVQKNMLDNSVRLYRILSDNKHIGNIRISEIDPIESECQVAIVIGDASSRGCGIGRRAIGLATDFAHGQLGIRTVLANVMARNTPSLKAFVSIGYQEVRQIPDQFSIDDIKYDGIWLAHRADSA